MYERMLNKQIVPKENEIKEYIGKKSSDCIETIKNELEKVFELNMELKFPFGKNYGWGYKVSHKTKHLFYIFFEKGSITVTLQINKIKTERETEKYNQLTEEGRKYWENRYPCGENGGWIHYRITNKKQLKDIGVFLGIRTNKEINNLALKGEVCWFREEWILCGFNTHKQFIVICFWNALKGGVLNPQTE